MQLLNIITEAFPNVTMVSLTEEEYDKTRGVGLYSNKISIINMTIVNELFKSISGWKGHCVGYPHTANNIIGVKNYITESNVTPIAIHTSYLKLLLSKDKTITHFAYCTDSQLELLKKEINDRD